MCLRDLDDRRAGGSFQQSHAGGTIAPVRGRDHLSLTGIVCCCFDCIGGGVGLSGFPFYQLYGSYQQRLTTAEAQNQEAMVLLHPAVKAQITPPTATQVAPEQAQISAVFVTQLEQGSYRSAINTKGRASGKRWSQTELMIKLPNTELTTLLPSVAEHPLVDSLDVASAQRGLILKVTLAKAANFRLTC